MRHLRIFTILALLLVPACETTVYEQAPDTSTSRSSGALDYNVVLFIIDGPRWTETFGDPTHTYADQMWNQLRPLGSICSNFRNNGTTITVSGHTTMLTGVLQNLANDGSERPDEPTLFEYFRKETGAPQSAAVVVGGKPKLTACAYSNHPDYGAAYAAAESLGLADDCATFNEFMTRIQTDQPRLIMASFSLVDQIAHANDWPGYLNQIGIVDSLAALAWSTLQADPAYAGKTYMFITADHGRHDDAHGGFQNHGDGCDGCEHLPFMVLGPDIRPGFEVTNLYTQRDVCPTVGALLGIQTPHSTGFFMSEIFEPVTSGIRE